MDQLKEILQQAIKYRFWIAVGLAALFPLIGYYAGHGDLAKAEQDEITKIKAADQKVKPYVSGQIYSPLWSDTVKEKTGLLTNDVNASWRRLYDRQAPLLTWPKEVDDRFPIWGASKWPENVDLQRVNAAVLDYIQVYPRYVTEVYKSFQPFDPQEGKGIVAAPPEKDLLQTSEFDEVRLPTLGQVWSAQYKLWIQRTMLDIVKRVNDKGKAKDWESAPIKQVASLEVASILAQDQKSIAKGETLKEMPEILPPGAAAPATTADASMPGSSAKASAGTIQYISAPGEEQFTIVPVAMTVYIDQDRINDFLVEFQNSPMAIQIMDFEIRPTTGSVVKPVQGMDSSTYGGMMGGGSGMSGYGMGNGSDMMRGRGNGMPSSYGRGNLMGGGLLGGRSLGGGLPGAAGGAGSNRPGGKSVASDTLKELANKGKTKKDDKDKDKAKEEEPTASNPYFNVVEVTIKGQARFYKMPPPAEAPPATSPGATPPETTATPAAAPQPAAPPATTVAPEGPPILPAPVPPGTTPPGAPAATPPAPEAPKADAATAEPPKPDAPKDAPKPESPPAEPPKGEATPKGGDSPMPKF